jgi:hypothetical protein
VLLRESKSIAFQRAASERSVRMWTAHVLFIGLIGDEAGCPQAGGSLSAGLIPDVDVAIRKCDAST